MTQVAADVSRYWGLGRSDLTAMADALAGCWERIGVIPGDQVAIYDFASSPLTLFASSGYVPYLIEGAADLLGCPVICNDGLPEFADRCVRIIKYTAPRFVFVESELVDPLVTSLAREALTLPECTLVLDGDEMVHSPSHIAGLADATGARVTQVLRADAALFFAAACRRDPVLFHPDTDHYTVEVQRTGGDITQNDGAAGALVISNNIVLTTPVVRYATDLNVTLVTGPCRCGATVPSVRVV